MKTTQVRTFDAGRRVEGFLDANAATLGTAVAASLRTKLDTAVTQLDQLRHDQETAKAAAVGETANQAGLRSDLYKHLVAPIGEVAKVNLKGSTDFPALVVSAAAEKRSEFVTSVNSQAEAAARYEQMLIDHGLPANSLPSSRLAWPSCWRPLPTATRSKPSSSPPRADWSPPTRRCAVSSS